MDTNTLKYKMCLSIMIIVSIKQHLTNISSSIHEKVRNCRPEVFYKKGVLRNFTKFTGKHLCQSLFFNKVAVLRPAALLKRDSGAGVFGATCSIFHPSKKNAASILQEILSVVPSAKIVAEI